MPFPPLAKIEAKTAAEICARFELSEPAQSLPREGASPASFLERLIAERHFHDAIRFLAFGLPKREVIWWAARCARLPGGPATRERQAALELVERWCAAPGEDLRRAAMAAAEKAKLDNAAGCTALAVFFSGGSVAPPEAPPVPPVETVTAQVAASAVLMAAIENEPEKAEEKYQRFLEQGIAVAAGRDQWSATA